MEKERLGKFTMPGIGFGTLGSTGDAGCALVEAALAEGYRYIDTSRFYGNEEAVGKALARSSVPRADVWVTTKLLHPKTPPQPDLRLELDKSLRLLQTDYVDLLLMHWPRPDVSLEWALGEFAELRRQGKARTIGYYRGLVTAFQRRALSGTDGFGRLLRELDADVTVLEALAGVHGIWPPLP